MIDTFTNPTDYNEWNIDAADTVGIFVKFGQVPQIASRFKLSDVPGYDPMMGTGTIIGPHELTTTEINQAFPSLPILTIYEGEIRTIEGCIASPYV